MNDPTPQESPKTSDGYYLCRQDDHTAIDGPYRFPGQVARLVDEQEIPGDFCNMSRYMLAKIGKYPRTKAGEQKLQEDLSKAKCVQLANDILSPERFGFAVTAEVRDAARAALGIEPVEQSQYLPSCR